MIFLVFVRICFNPICSDDHDDGDDPSLGEDSGGGDGDGTEFHQVNFIPTNIIDSMCIWYTGDTTGSDDSKSENNSEKNSRLALSNRSGSNLSRSYKSTAGSGTGSETGN